MVQQSQMIADALHDSLLRTLAEIAPVGGPSVPIGVVCDALLMVLAGVLTVSSQAPEEQIERLVRLFRQRLEEALANAMRTGGHA